MANLELIGDAQKKPWGQRDLRDLGWPAKLVVWLIKLLAAWAIVYFLIGIWGLVATKYKFGKAFPADIIGRSLEPTVHQPVQIGHLSFGAALWVNREADRPVDSLLLFRTPDGVVEAKRVQKVDESGPIRKYWFVTDNSGVTGEGSGFSQSGYTWISDDRVIGRVVSIWSLRRTLRWFSAYGRELNRVEFAHHPNEIFIRGHDIVVSCGNKLSSGKRELAGWKADCWNDKTSHQLRLVRQAVGKKEYALLDVPTWQLKTGLSCDGSLLLPSNVERQYAWGRVVGPLVYAMDDDPVSCWVVNPATDNSSSSSMLFAKPVSGVLILNGGGDAACTVEILIDGKLSAREQGSWNLVRMPFAATRRIEIRQLRNEAASSSGIGKVQIINMS